MSVNSDKLIESLLQNYKRDSVKCFNYLNNAVTEQMTVSKHLLQAGETTGYIFAEDTCYRKNANSDYSKRFFYTKSKEDLIWLIQKLQICFPKQFTLYSMMPNTPSLLFVNIDFLIPKEWSAKRVRVSVGDLMTEIKGQVECFIDTHSNQFVNSKYDSQQHSWWQSSRAKDGTWKISMHLLNKTVQFEDCIKHRKFLEQMKIHFEKKVASLESHDTQTSMVTMIAWKAVGKVDTAIARMNSFVRFPGAIKKRDKNSEKKAFNKFAMSLSVAQQIDLHFGTGTKIWIASNAENGRSVITWNMTSKNTNSKFFLCRDSRVQVYCPEAKRKHKRNGQICKKYFITGTDWWAKTILCLDPQCSGQQHLVAACGDLKYPFGWSNLSISVRTMQLLETALVNACNDNIVTVTSFDCFFMATEYKYKKNSDRKKDIITFFGTKNVRCASTLCDHPNPIQATICDDICHFKCSQCPGMFSFSLRNILFWTLLIIFDL